MNALLLALGLFATTTAALAAPPPGHPTAAEAIEQLGIPAAATNLSVLRHRATVITAQDSNAFTYIELEASSGNERYWIAAPLMAVRSGEVIRHDDGRIMHNFHSRKHNVTFDRIIFVSRAIREENTVESGPASSGGKQ